jgi:hypothetical protein
MVNISRVDSMHQRNISSLHGCKGDEYGSREALGVGLGKGGDLAQVEEWGPVTGH